MEKVAPSQIGTFLKRFRFHGGLQRTVRLRNEPDGQATAVVIALVLDTESNRRVRLKMQIDGVEEYRFQRRPVPGSRRLRDVRLGYFNGLMYLNLDAYAGDEAPALHDFRASDAFVGGRVLSWEIVERKTPPGS